MRRLLMNCWPLLARTRCPARTPWACKVQLHERWVIGSKHRFLWTFAAIGTCNVTLEKQMRKLVLELLAKTGFEQGFLSRKRGRWKNSSLRFSQSKNTTCWLKTLFARSSRSRFGSPSGQWSDLSGLGPPLSISLALELVPHGGAIQTPTTRGHARTPSRG